LQTSGENLSKKQKVHDEVTSDDFAFDVDALEEGNEEMEDEVEEDVPDVLEEAVAVDPVLSSSSSSSTATTQIEDAASEDEEEPLEPYDLSVDGVPDTTAVPLFDDDGAGVSQYEDDADVDARERREAQAKKKKREEELPEDAKYHMFDASTPFPLPQPFNPRWLGRHKQLGSLANMSPLELIDWLYLGIMKHIVRCYNKKIEQEHTGVKPLTLGVLKKWYGIRMYMAIFKRHEAEDYFKDFQVGTRFNRLPNAAAYMSYRDFKEVKANLRFEDYELGHDRGDKAWKVRSVFMMLKQKFREAMPAPGQWISMDEAMMKYYGRLCPIVKSMPQKPIKKGFLFYCAVDYKTKWAFDINLSDGAWDDKDFSSVPWGKTGQRVLDLIDHIPGEYHVIVMDNFYSSEALAKELLRKNQYMIGTVRKNRLPPGKPAEMMSKSKHPKPTKKYPKGTCQGSVNYDNNIALLSLMDSGLVYLLDTFHGPGVMDSIHRRDGPDEKTLHVHKSFKDYNDFMGGVDAWDALRTGYFGIEMTGRTIKWTVRFVDGLFNMALSQAWVAHRHHHPSDGKYNRIDFMNDICEAFLDNTDDISGPTTRHADAVTHDDKSSRYHTLAQTTETGADGNRKVKTVCVYCHSKTKVSSRHAASYRTTWHCVECAIALHPECMGPYHNEKAGFRA
jgi:hypothetical protein